MGDVIVAVSGPVRRCPVNRFESREYVLRRDRHSCEGRLIMVRMPRSEFAAFWAKLEGS